MYTGMSHISVGSIQNISMQLRKPWWFVAKNSTPSDRK
jgi:hypothetical protein